MCYTLKAALPWVWLLHPPHTSAAPCSETDGGRSPVRPEDLLHQEHVETPQQKEEWDIAKMQEVPRDTPDDVIISRPLREGAGQLQQATASDKVNGREGGGGDSSMNDVRGRTTSMLTHIMTPCVNWRAHAFIERSIWCSSTPSFATLSR